MKASPNMWFDREGKPLRDYGEIEKLLRDVKYKRVAQTTLKDGTWISTVWLGLDHSFGRFTNQRENPLIFETMVFPSKEKLLDEDVERYSTLEEAKAGHKRMVSKWRLINRVKEVIK